MLRNMIHPYEKRELEKIYEFHPEQEKGILAFGEFVVEYFLLGENYYYALYKGEEITDVAIQPKKFIIIISLVGKGYLCNGMAGNVRPV